MDEIESNDGIESEDEREYEAAPADDEVPFHIPRD
jgi:hypothetical protein